MRLLRVILTRSSCALPQVSLQRGIKQRIFLTLNPGVRARGFVRVLLRRGGEDVLRRLLRFLREGESLEVEMWLSPGEYVVEAQVGNAAGRALFNADQVAGGDYQS